MTKKITQSSVDNGILYDSDTLIGHIMCKNTIESGRLGLQKNMFYPSSENWQEVNFAIQRCFEQFANWLKQGKLL